MKLHILILVEETEFIRAIDFRFLAEYRIVDSVMYSKLRVIRIQFGPKKYFGLRGENASVLVKLTRKFVRITR